MLDEVLDRCSLTVVDRVAAPCREVDEDRAGAAGCAAWVLDGATPVRVHESGLLGSPAAALVAAADAALRRHVSAPTVRDVVRRSIDDVRSEAIFARSVVGADGSDRPSACLALVRLEAGSRGLLLRHLMLGDACVVVRSGSELYVVDDPESLQGEREHLEAVAAGQPLEERLRERRRTMNTDDGYWIYADDPAAADHAMVGEVAVSPGDHVLLATDGFARLVGGFGVYGWDGLLEAALDRGLEPLVRQLRRVERADEQGLRYPRVKVSDDATAVLLRVDASAS